MRKLSVHDLVGLVKLAIERNLTMTSPQCYQWCAAPLAPSALACTVPKHRSNCPPRICAHTDGPGRGAGRRLVVARCAGGGRGSEVCRWKAPSDYSWRTTEFSYLMVSIHVTTHKSKP